MELVTGYGGKAHITPENWADLNRGFSGMESYVTETGRKFEAELISNNLLKIHDGCGIMQGRQVVIPKGQSDEVTIQNGTQGMKRIDLVVERYTKNPDTKIETTETVLIKGTPSTNPTVPAYTVGDIRSGDMKADWPLYEVELNGINVVEVRPVFKVLFSIDTINTYLSHKVDIVKLTSAKETFTGEYYGGKPVYAKIIDVGAMPNNATKTLNTGIKGAGYFWIDPSNSMARNGGGSYPIPYVDPNQVLSGIAARIYNGGETLAVWTKTSWSGYSAFVTIKYTKL